MGLLKGLVGKTLKLLDTWPYYYVEKAKENLQWKYSLVCILIILSIIFVLLIVVKIFDIFNLNVGKARFDWLKF